VFFSSLKRYRLVVLYLIFKESSMNDRKRVFRCQQCGYVSVKWLGRCPDCQTWHSMVEETVSKKLTGRIQPSLSENRPVLLNDITGEAEARTLTGLSEWDRVLGGGLIPGSLVLLAGDPGIGKSTLLMQALSWLAQEQKVLYVSGEESLQQLKLRATRLAIDSPHLFVFAENSLDAVLEVVEREPPIAIAVDSIQIMSLSFLDVAPGSITQVRECASKLMRVAKEKNISVFMIGHVTKEGAIAGPRVMEHLADTVLYLEGDRSHTFRLLRAVKNRYGSTNEIGVFEMKETGLEEVPNPSQLLLAERPVGAPGSVVVCSMEGTRPLLVELQALVSGTGLWQPRRTSTGVDSHRLSLLLAVLEKRLGFHMGQQDVFVNVAGGVRLVEPAADLGMVTALISSYLDCPLPSDLVVWGEVGLAGEIRGVGHGPTRLMESQKLGFSRHLIPKSNADQLSQELGTGCMGVGSLQDVLQVLFGED
jgi:DNA repair protein RadA/Sms